MPTRLRLLTPDASPGSLEMARHLAALAGRDAVAADIVPSGGVLQAIDLLSTPDPASAAVVPATAIPYMRRSGIMWPSVQALRYIARVDQPVLHLLAAQPITEFGWLAGQRVSFGLRDSPTQITASLLFDRSGLRVEPVFLDPPEAIRALLAGAIAALVMVAPRPAPLLSNLTHANAVRLLSLLPLLDLIPTATSTRITARDYPLLMDEAPGAQPDIETVAIPMVLALLNWPAGSVPFETLARFTRGLFSGAAGSGTFDPTANVPGWVRFGPALVLPRAPEPMAEDVPTATAPARRTVETRVEPPRPTSPAAPSPTPPDRPNLSAEQKNRLFEDFLRWRNAE